MRIDTSGLDNFLRKLDKLQNEKAITSNIVEQVSQKGEEILNEKYSKINYDISGNELPNVYSQVQDSNNAVISAEGEQVAYIEFGTGTIGKNTVEPKLEAVKHIIGAMDYNSGKTIKKDVPVFIGTTKGGRNKYNKVLGWYRPTYALSLMEQLRYSNWVNGINSDEKIKPNSKRYHSAMKRAYKYTHGTEGIRAGQQIYDTARELENEIPNIVNNVIKEELR